MSLSPFDPLALARWDPFSETTSLRDALNRLVETSFVRPSSALVGTPLTVPVDVSENENAYTIEASLPGMKPEEVNITVQENVLTISGERKERLERKEGDQVIYQEHRYGSFSRSFSLPTSVDADKAKAQFENGVLRLTIPKAEAARPKQIKINAAHHAVEGEHVQRQQVSGPSETSKV